MTRAIVESSGRLFFGGRGVAVFCHLLCPISTDDLGNSVDKPLSIVIWKFRENILLDQLVIDVYPQIQFRWKHIPQGI